MNIFGYEITIRKAAPGETVVRIPRNPRMKPPSETPLRISVHDEWLGVGREDQVITGYWLGGSYYTSQHIHIPSKLVTGWSMPEVDHTRTARRIINVAELTD